MSDKLDPALAAAVDKLRRDLKADLGEALRRGASAWAEQSNRVLATHAARLERLERRTLPISEKPKR